MRTKPDHVVLTKFRRNQVFEAIEEAGLSPEEFVWDHSADKSTLRHRPTGAYFVFGGTPGSYDSSYLAPEAPVEERTEQSHYALMQQVGFWLSALKLDIGTPDLWAELRGEAELLTGPTPGDGISNTPFTPEEQEEIATRLHELRDDAKRRYSLTDDQTQLLDAKIDQLIDAAGRLGRLDWREVFVGAMVGYVLTAALPPESARHILLALLGSVGHLFGHGPPLLPP